MRSTASSAAQSNMRALNRHTMEPVQSGFRPRGPNPLYTSPRLLVRVPLPSDLPLRRNSMTLLRRSIYCGLLVLLTATASLAQATAQLTGTVTDPSGGVLPGATVIATQTDTGFK